MSYTIGEMARVLGVAPSTLRYYDKEGLLPFVGRSSGGVRVFEDSDLGWLRIIDCLKRTGLSIKEIKQYITLYLEGDSTIDDRLALFRRQRQAVLDQMEQLRATLHMLDYKCWYYETAQAAGTCDVLPDIPLSQVPEEFHDLRTDFTPQLP